MHQSNPPRVLVVEDEYEIASAIARELQEHGITVVGPVPNVADALARINEPDALQGALLDLNLRGEMAFPVADALAARQIPFVIATGYGSEHIPAKYRLFPRLEKPFEPSALVQLWTRLHRNRPPPQVRALSPPASGNTILDSLERETAQQLIASAKEVSLPKGALVLPGDGRRAPQCCFLTSGVAVCEAMNRQRDVAAVGLVAREGIVGVQNADAPRWPRLTFRMAIAGSGLRLDLDRLAEFAATSPKLREAMDAAAATFLHEVAGTVVSSSHDNLERRVARWLYELSEKGERLDITVTHEEIALALGVRRPGITVALNQLRGRGCIELGRGEVRIRDKQALLKNCLGDTE